MNARTVRAATLAIAGALLCAGAASSGSEEAPTTTTLAEQDARTLDHDGTKEGTALSASSIVIAVSAGTGAIAGPEVSAHDPFDRVCVSVNAETPGDSIISVFVRVRLARGSWTDWLPLGVLGLPDDEAKVPRSAAGPTDGPAKVSVDTIEVAPEDGAPAGRAVQVRLTLRRGKAGDSPRVFRVAFVAWPKGSLDHDPQRHPAWGKVLPVAARSQCVEDPAIAGKICSPTSLSMVLAFFGLARETSEVCKGVLDRRAGIYGNWALNVAYASRLGLEATVVRMGGFGPLEAEIAAGHPVVISHRWSRGELEGAPIASSDGHLIVVRGFTKEGDVVVNDPCADPRKGQSIERTYRRSDIHRTWLENADGIAYVLRPRTHS